MHYLACSGNVAAFEFISQTKLNKNFAPDNYKWTPLHYAAKYGHLRTVRRLIREKCDPNVLTSHGLSVLHFLARFEPTYLNHKSICSQYLQTLAVCVFLLLFLFWKIVLN